MRFNPRSSLAVVLLAAALAPTALGQDGVDDRIREAQGQERLLAQVNARIAVDDFSGGLRLLEEGGADGAHPRLLNARGVCLAGLGRHAEAIEVYEGALLRDINRAEIHRNLAISLEAEGITGRAMSEFADAVRLDPRDPETRLALGTALSRYRRHDAAWEELQMALKLRPDDARIQRALGRVAEARSDTGAALEHWSQVDTLEPSPESARALARLSPEGRTQLGYFLACVERDSMAADCRAAAGSIYLRRGEIDAALVQLRAAVRLGEAGEALHNLFLALQLSGRGEEAENWLESYEPPFAESWGALALLRRDAGDTPAALAAVRRGRELDPEDLDLANLEAVLREELGDTGAAVEIWREILERDPTHPQARANLRGRGGE